MLTNPPALMVRLPLTVDLEEPKFTPAEMVTLLKIVLAVPETAAAALNATVPVPAVKVPLLVQLPETVKVLEDPSKVPLIVTDLAVDVAFTVIVVEPGMITSVVAEGTPPHQLPPSFQLPVDNPIQVPAALPVPETDTFCVVALVLVWEISPDAEPAADGEKRT